MKNSEHGQALIALICFSLIAITIIASIVLISVVTTTAGGKTQESSISFDVAESGAENAVLRLLRDPSYTGETLSVGNGSATITVSGTNPKTILSTSSGTFRRTVQVVASDSAGVLTVTSWKEL